MKKISPEKIAFIKEKIRNGITLRILNPMLKEEFGSGIGGQTFTKYYNEILAEKYGDGGNVQEYKNILKQVLNAYSIGLDKNQIDPDFVIEFGDIFDKIELEMI